MYRFKKAFTILLVLVMFIGVLAACSPNETDNNPTEPVVEDVEPTEVVVVDTPTEVVDMGPVYVDQPFGENLPTGPTIDTPLVVTQGDFSQKFSPFFSDSTYDADVSGMTQIGVLTTDRVGGIIPNAIEGETRVYNGVEYLYKGAADTSVVYDEESDTTKYTASLRIGMKFSDGTPVTSFLTVAPAIQYD